MSGAVGDQQQQESTTITEEGGGRKVSGVGGASSGRWKLVKTLKDKKAEGSGSGAGNDGSPTSGSNEASVRVVATFDFLVLTTTATRRLTGRSVAQLFLFFYPILIRIIIGYESDWTLGSVRFGVEKVSLVFISCSVVDIENDYD